VRWVKKKTGPAAENIADKDALAAAEKAHEVVVLAYFKELKVRDLRSDLGYNPGQASHAIWRGSLDNHVHVTKSALDWGRLRHTGLPGRLLWVHGWARSSAAHSGRLEGSKRYEVRDSERRWQSCKTRSAVT
jgi:hypothetical protein